MSGLIGDGSPTRIVFTASPHAGDTLLARGATLPYPDLTAVDRDRFFVGDEHKPRMRDPLLDAPKLIADI